MHARVSLAQVLNVLYLQAQKVDDNTSDCEIFIENGSNRRLENKIDKVRSRPRPNWVFAKIQEMIIQ